MPSTRNVTKEAPLSATALDQHRPFIFPPGCHLLITTPRHIFAWDAPGVKSIFQSSKGGIVAAREAKDGSGLLAVAGRNVVVMHDTKRGKEESWGLNAPQEEVRHLEYSNDAKSLFLSTTSDGTIQHYSTERSRLLDPAQRHASSPVAVAVSATGHMILSASHDPPAIYLKNLAHNTSPTLVHPNASTSQVSCAVFHPERPNVFMLAFRDGTVAAYDASRISKEAATQFSQASVNDGEISRISNLHRTVVSGDASGISSPIVGVAFLPGFKTRAVTAGRDGRCRLIDFAKNGEVMRTWHAKAPVTSISVLALKASQRVAGTGSTSRKQSTHTIGGPTTTESVISVGRVDGKVNIYDTVGLLLVQKVVSSQEERILSVEWVQGPSPKLLEGSDIGHFSDDTAASLKPARSHTGAAAQPVTKSAEKELPAVLQEQFGLGLPPDLRATGKETPSTIGRKFTVHPDEIEATTVRYVPSPNKVPLVPVSGGHYHDLFSPVKPAGAIAKSPPLPKVSSPPRSRPRISSQTFVKSPVMEDTTDVRQASALPSDSHATSSDTGAQQVCSSELQPRRTNRRVGTQGPPSSTKRRCISFNPNAVYVGGDAARSGASITNHRFDNNARILADLRGLSGKDSMGKKGLLSTYETSSRNQADVPVSTSTNRHPRHQPEGESAQEAFMHGARTWPDSSSPPSQIPEEDLWLTSGSDGESHDQQTKIPRRPLTRPPGRQTSRSQVNSKGTISTTTEVIPSGVPTVRNPMDGSTDQDMITAREELSPEETFFPVSDNVRQLFPRSSSLSPHKSQAPSKPTKSSPTRKKGALAEVALSTALGRQPKSPWARVKARNPTSSPRKPTTRSVRKNEFVTVLEDITGDTVRGVGLPRSDSFTCLTCPETKARVQALEGEVAHLKGEVLALKAVLRQNGLPFPAFLR